MQPEYVPLALFESVPGWMLQSLLDRFHLWSEEDFQLERCGTLGSHCVYERRFNGHLAFRDKAVRAVL